MNDLTRQETLVDKDIMKVSSPVVIGCGGIGSWLALFLVKVGVVRLSIWDGDLVEESNLHRTPYSPEDVGTFKVEALQKILLKANPELELTVLKTPWEGDTLLTYNVVFCAVDGVKVRKEIFQEAERSRAVYYDLGAEQTGGNISSSPADWEFQTAGPREYFTPIFIAPVAAVAALAVWAWVRFLNTETRIYESTTPNSTSRVLRILSSPAVEDSYRSLFLQQFSSAPLQESPVRTVHEALQSAQYAQRVSTEHQPEDLLRSFTASIEGESNGT